MKSLSHRTRLAAATGALVVASLALPAGPAFADHDPRHTQLQAREAYCEDVLRGEFTAGAAQQNDRCVVVVEERVTGPFGAPTTTTSEPRPTGLSPIFVDGHTLPAGAPATESEYRNIGNPVVVQTFRVGTPEISTADRDAGEPVSVPVIVPGEPSTETRTEQGTPTSSTAPGVRNCEPVAQGKDSRSGKSKGKDNNPPVEKCERTVVTTTTTPTTEVTTVTTPQERVTTTTQPRETVTTTRTPSTEVFTSTQARELCLVTTQRTEFIRTTTQTMEATRTVTYRQRTAVTTVTTTYRFTNGTTNVVTPVVFQNADNPRTQLRFEPTDELYIASVTTVAAPSVETATPMPGTPIITEACAPTEPDVTAEDGATTYTSVDTVAPTAPVITEEREDLEPLVVVTRTPGQPVVTVTETGTGNYCVNNPSSSKHDKGKYSNSQQCDNDPYMPKPGKADDESKPKSGSSRR
jgi:hypothetical protein